MDRFFLRLQMGYPRRGGEDAAARGGTERVLAAIPAVLGPEQVLELQDGDREGHGVRAAARLPPRPRARDARHGGAPVAVSTRGAQALFRADQAHALLQGRAYATPDDAQAVAEAVLAHRILSVSSDGFGAGGREREIVRKILSQVAVPCVRERYKCEGRSGGMSPTAGPD